MFLYFNMFRWFCSFNIQVIKKTLLSDVASLPSLHKRSWWVVDMTCRSWYDTNITWGRFQLQTINTDLVENNQYNNSSNLHLWPVCCSWDYNLFTFGPSLVQLKFYLYFYLNLLRICPATQSSCNWRQKVHAVAVLKEKVPGKSGLNCGAEFCRNI